MIHEEDKNKLPKKENEDENIKPDPETLHTTDPQDHMKGPVSSLVQKAKETIEDDDEETGKEKYDSEEK